MIEGQFGPAIGGLLTADPGPAATLGTVIVGAAAVLAVILMLTLIAQDRAGSTGAFGRRLIGAAAGFPYLLAGLGAGLAFYAALAFGVFYTANIITAWSREAFGAGQWQAAWAAFVDWTAGLPYPVKFPGAVIWFLAGTVTGLKWQHAWKGWTGAAQEFIRMQFVGTRFGRGGSAGFGDLMDEWGMRFRRGCYLLGASMYAPGWWIGDNDDRGLVTIAATRSGKGRSSIIPNLILWPESALVIDPKGTNAAVTARRRGRGGGRVTQFLGQEVHVLDPFGIVKDIAGATFNPLATIDVEADTVREDIYAIADAMIEPSPGKDPHWEEIAKLILSGMIAHEVAAARAEGKVTTLSDVRAHLRQGASYLDRLFGAMARDFAAGGLPAAAAAVFASAGTNERGSFFTTLMRNTAWLDSVVMQRVLCAKSDFDIADLKRKPMTIYVVLPPELLGTHARFMRLFVSMAMHAASKGGKGRYRTLFVLDEFFALGRMTVLEQAAAQLASFGVRMWPIVQNVTQLSSLYHGNWETYLSGAGAVQAFGVNDHATSEYLVKRLGRHMIGPPGRKMVANLREPDEVGRDVARELRRALLLPAGGKPLMVRRLDYDRVFPQGWYSPDPDFGKPDEAAPPAPPPGDGNYVGAGREEHPPAALPEREAVREKARPAEAARADEEETEDFAARMARAWEKERESLIGPAEAKEPEPPTPKKRRAAAQPSGRAPQGVNESSKALEKLNAMVGLEEVKAEMRAVLDQIGTNRKRVREGLKAVPLSRHMIFTGNPGTGKTTVAKIVGDIFRETGLLRKGHLVEVKRGDLVAQHVGHTAPKTRTKCMEALDGVLFIDEAYALVRDEIAADFGAEAIEEIMTFMEDNRERIVVIAAGYSEEMERFVGSNPGLASRFTKTIPFADYNAEEMEQIFAGFCKEEGFELGPGAAEKVRVLMLGIQARRGARFGNGRTVRNAFQAAVGKYNERIAAMTDATREQLVTLDAGDIPGDAGGFV